MSTLGEEIIEGLQEALEYSRGNKEGYRVHRVRVPDKVDVRGVRSSPRMTQEEFAQAEHSWKRFAGMFEDEPLFDEVLEEIEAHRREIDRDGTGA